MLRSQLNSVAEATASATGGDLVPPHRQTEPWIEHCDGVGSPLIDIFTDSSSQLSDDESRSLPEQMVDGHDHATSALVQNGRVQYCHLTSAGRNVIQVVDQESGGDADGGDIIWMVENDMEVGDDATEWGSETALVPSFDRQHIHKQGTVLGGTASLDGTDASSRSPVSISPVFVRHAQVVKKQKKPRVKRKDRPVSAKRMGKVMEVPRSISPSRQRKACLVLSSTSDRSMNSDVLHIREANVDSGVADGPTTTAATVTSACLSTVTASPEPVPSAVAPHAAVNPPQHFFGFPAGLWRSPRSRWLRQLAAIAGEERVQAADRADAAVARLRQLAATAAVRFPPAVDPVPASRSAEEEAAAAQVGNTAAVPPVTVQASHRTADLEDTVRTASGDGSDRARPLPTYVSLMPDSEKERFKRSFASMLSLRHVDEPPPPVPSAPSRTRRQRLRMCNVASHLTSSPGQSVEVNDVPKNNTRMPDVLWSPSAERSALLPNHVIEPRLPQSTAGQLSGDQTRRPRRRLLDFSQLVEVVGVLDLSDTYSGSAEPPQLVPESAAEPACSAASSPPQLAAQRWYRDDTARCPICRKFITRVLLQLHLRLHRTGYRGCDVCGQVLESDSALYRHRLGHEPPRYPCSRCDRHYDSLAKLERHRASAHCLVCERCGARLATSELVLSHDCSGEGAAKRDPVESVAPPPPPAAPAPAAAPVVTSPTPVEQVQRHGTSLVDGGLSCHVCGKSFLVKFNYTMHMKMVHKGVVSEMAQRAPPTAMAAPSICPDSVLACLSDILSADLYSEIVSVV